MAKEKCIMCNEEYEDGNMGSPLCNKCSATAVDASMQGKGIAIELGPTGKFPKRKINEDDKGELKVAIMTNHEKNVVVIEFGTTLSWVGLTTDIARAMGEQLISRADDLEGI